MASGKIPLNPRNQDGIRQSFKPYSDLQSLINAAKETAFIPIVVGVTGDLANTLAGRSGSGIAICKYVSNTDSSTNRIDYICVVGGADKQGSFHQGSIKISDSSIKSFTISPSLTGTHNNNTMYAFGYVTTAGKELDLYIPFSYKDGGSISITSLKMSIRHSGGGYVGSSTDDVKNLITGTTLVPTQNLLRIVVTNSDGWGITNNTPVSGYVILSYVLS